MTVSRVKKGFYLLQFWGAEYVPGIEGGANGGGRPWLCRAKGFEI